MSSPMNVGPGLGTRINPPVINPHIVPAYSLIVAGATHAGKSSLLRLLVDTALISPHATQAHVDSLARFVRAVQQHPSEPRFTECEVEVLWGGERVLLRLVDSPGLDLTSEDELERGLRDILSYVEARYVEGARDESTVGESHVHLCLYVLDPANITPRGPSAASAPASYPYNRTSSASSFSSSSSPPSPTLGLPGLPPAEITAIRRLSSRVNVLPVLGRCDSIGLDRLAEIKRAVRMDLAEAGLGFGIFDEAGEKGVAPTALQKPIKQDPAEEAKDPEPETVPLLPYALFAPDCYAPGARKKGRRELASIYEADAKREEVKDADIQRIQALKGHYVRRYRWGVLDALDTRHSDFVALRRAAMEHRKVLKDYTKDYLYEKFKVDSLLAAQTQQPRILHASAHPHHPYHDAPPSRHLPPPQPPPPMPVSVPAYRHSVHPHSPLSHHPQHPHQHTLPPIHTAHAHAHPGSVHALLNHAAPRDEEREREAPYKREREQEETNGTQGEPVVGMTVNGRKRKITMACNFCRSRKLKCDGIRPACAQCVKRGNTCDYQPHGAAAAQGQGGPAAGWKVKRGATAAPAPAPAQIDPRHPSDVDARIARHDLDARRHSISHPHHPHPPHHVHPHPHPHPHHARDEDIDELAEDGDGASTGAEMDVEDDARTVYAPEGRKRVSVDMLIAETLGENGKPYQRVSPGEQRYAYGEDATAPPAPVHHTPAPPPAPPPASNMPWSGPVMGMGTGMSVIDVGSEGDKKKRLNRQSANYGSKAVACVHCRARKTRCDAARPACGNCARRSLACSYIHTQPSQPRSKGKKAAAAAAKEEAARQQRKAGDATPPPAPTRESSQHPSQSQWTSRSPSHSPQHASPIPTDIMIEESAERDRPRSPAAPPIATLAAAVARAPSPAPPPSNGTAVYTNGNGVQRSRSSSVGVVKRKSPPVVVEEEERPEKRRKWMEEETQGPPRVVEEVGVRA